MFYGINMTDKKDKKKKKPKGFRFLKFDFTNIHKLLKDML